MAGFETFSEQDWQLILGEIRLLVISSGFSSWDEAAIAALDDEAEDYLRPREALIRYGRSFISFLKTRSSHSVDRLRSRLSELIEREDGSPVEDAAVRSGGDGLVTSILSGDTRGERLAEELSQLIGALSEGRDDYFEQGGDQ